MGISGGAVRGVESRGVAYAVGREVRGGTSGGAVRGVESRGVAYVGVCSASSCTSRGRVEGMRVPTGVVPRKTIGDLDVLGVRMTFAETYGLGFATIEL